MRSSPNFEVLKEPRGFIKLIQIFIAIFAFAACTGYRGEATFLQKCTDNTTTTTTYTHTFRFEYPFGDDSSKVTLHACNAVVAGEYTFDLGYTGSTHYFVAVGVCCFLYCLVMLAYYIMWEEDIPTPTDSKFSPPVIDFVVSAVLAFFWFTSAIAMAASVTGIKNATGFPDVFKKIAQCTPGLCTSKDSPKYATLDIAAVLGFLNVFVWCGNMWFLFKETPWHSARGAPATVSGQQQPQISRPAAAI